MLLSRSGEIRKVAPLLRFRFWMEGMLEKLSVGLSTHHHDTRHL